MLSDAFSDFLPHIVKIFFAQEAERPPLMQIFFTKTFPTFLKSIDQYCARGGFLVDNSLTTADFWIGGIYVNYCINPNVGFGKDQWSEVL